MSSSDEEEKSTKPIKKIFVRGLSQEATVETIREHFRAFGEIETVEFFYDCNSKKDFIFVMYKDEASIKSHYNMGQHGSKSSIEARVIFQRFGEVDMYQRIDASCTPAPVVRIQKKVISQSACVHSSSRALEKSTSWSQSRGDAGGLVYVMDNPTGGVWVKPGEKWARS
ncbi:hypothetical protein ABVT39_007816 [Epinephelus coioides]